MKIDLSHEEVRDFVEGLNEEVNMCIEQHINACRAAGAEQGTSLRAAMAEQNTSLRTAMAEQTPMPSTLRGA
jgi:hypothetical protein